VVTALRHRSLLNDSVGVGYLERHWPEALKESGAWSLAGLRQSFLNGSLTRLLDPDVELRKKIVEFVANREFGLGSGQGTDGSYQRIWFDEIVPPEEVSFEADLFLLRKDRAAALKTAPKPTATPGGGPPTKGGTGVEPGDGELPTDGGVIVRPPAAGTCTLRVSGYVPSELWNRLGNRLLPKLRSNPSLKLKVEFTLDLAADEADRLQTELRQALADLGLKDAVHIEVG
jgi:hypothetical protein